MPALVANYGYLRADEDSPAGAAMVTSAGPWISWTGSRRADAYE